MRLQAFFSIYFCFGDDQINGPAGGDVLLPIGGQPDPSRRCAFTNGPVASKARTHDRRTGIFDLAAVIIVLMPISASGCRFRPRGETSASLYERRWDHLPGNSVLCLGPQGGRGVGRSLAGNSAKVTFSVDRSIVVGDQSGRDPHRLHPSASAPSRSVRLAPAESTTIR